MPWQPRKVYPDNKRQQQRLAGSHTTGRQLWQFSFLRTEGRSNPHSILFSLTLPAVVQTKKNNCLDNEELALEIAQPLFTTCWSSVSTLKVYYENAGNQEESTPKEVINAVFGTKLNHFAKPHGETNHLPGDQHSRLHTPPHIILNPCCKDSSHVGGDLGEPKSKVKTGDGQSRPSTHTRSLGQYVPS